MGQIIMTVKAIDWTEGNVGHVGVREFGIITLCNKPTFINDVNIE